MLSGLAELIARLSSIFFVQSCFIHCHGIIVAPSGPKCDLQHVLIDGKYLVASCSVVCILIEKQETRELTGLPGSWSLCQIGVVLKYSVTPCMFFLESE